MALDRIDNARPLQEGAVVLNGARIDRSCIVGAGALVTEGKEFPDAHLIVGAPAKTVRALTPDQMAELAASAQHHVANAATSRTRRQRTDEQVG